MSTALPPPLPCTGGSTGYNNGGELNRTDAPEDLTALAALDESDRQNIVEFVTNARHVINSSAQIAKEEGSKITLRITAQIRYCTGNGTAAADIEGTLVIEAINSFCILVLFQGNLPNNRGEFAATTRGPYKYNVEYKAWHV